MITFLQHRWKHRVWKWNEYWVENIINWKFSNSLGFIIADRLNSICVMYIIIANTKNLLWAWAFCLSTLVLCSVNILIEVTEACFFQKIKCITASFRDANHIPSALWGCRIQVCDFSFQMVFYSSVRVWPFPRKPPKLPLHNNSANAHRRVRCTSLLSQLRQTHKPFVTITSRYMLSHSDYRSRMNRRPSVTVIVANDTINKLTRL